MSRFRDKIRKLRGLIFFIGPVLGFVYEIVRWKQQDIPHRAIFCSALVILTVLSLMWRDIHRTHRLGRRHRRHHRRDDFR